MDPSCTEVSAAQVRIVSDPSATTTANVLSMSPFEGISCDDADNVLEPCVDYEVRFCCEGCCPLLNVSGDPELTDYYENYPGNLQLTKNGRVLFKIKLQGLEKTKNVDFL